MKQRQFSRLRWMAKTVPRFLATLLPDVLAVLGAAAVTGGVWMLSDAAGWISAGVMLIAAAVIISRGGEGG